MRLSLLVAFNIVVILFGSVSARAEQSTAILLLGDSLSAAYGIDATTAWPALLQQRLDAENSQKTLINASISGETTAGGLARLPALLTEHHPQIVIIELGGNDGLRGLRLAAVRKNVEQMISASQAVGAHVMLIGMHLPPNYGPKYVADFHKIYTDLQAEKETALLPFLLEGVALTEGMMQSDGIHPTTEAQELILENVWTVLAPLLR